MTTTNVMTRDAILIPSWGQLPRFLAVQVQVQVRLHVQMAGLVQVQLHAQFELQVQMLVIIYSYTWDHRSVRKERGDRRSSRCRHSPLREVGWGLVWWTWAGLHHQSHHQHHKPLARHHHHSSLSISSCASADVSLGVSYLQVPNSNKFVMFLFCVTFECCRSFGPSK